MSQPRWQMARLTQVILLLLFCFKAAHATPVLENPPWKWRDGFVRISTEGWYYSSTANYDSIRGTFNRLPNGNNFSTYESNLKVRYNFSDNVSLYSSAGFASVTATNPATQKSNSAITDVRAGLDYLLWSHWFRAIAELEASFPTDKIDINTKRALTNDGVAYLRSSLFLYKPIAWFNNYIHIGVKVPDEGLAKLFLWGVGTELPFASKFLIGLGLDGYETLVGDELNRSSREAVTDRVDSGSHRFFAYNPAEISARTWIGFAPQRPLQLRVGYDQSINGQNAASGQTIFLSLSYNFEPKPSLEGFSTYYYQRDKIKSKSKKAIEKFDVQPEKEDKELFDPEDSFEPLDREPIGDSGPLQDGH